MIEIKNTLVSLFEDAQKSNLPVSIDVTNKRLIFTASKEEVKEVFSFMDQRKVKTDRGLIYPVTFAIVPKELKEH